MLHYITGGERSGKSSYAEKLASELTTMPVYLATSRRFDDTDFEARIQRHVTDRDNAKLSWQTIEEERYLSDAISNYLQAKQNNEDQSAKTVIVIDCVTLWLTNYVLDFDYDIDHCLTLAKHEIDKLVTLVSNHELTVFMISNEIGMSLHASTPAGRKFVSLQGWVNQYIAQQANKATMVVSGLPLVLKQ